MFGHISLLPRVALGLAGVCAFALVIVSPARAADQKMRYATAEEIAKTHLAKLPLPPA